MSCICLVLIALFLAHARPHNALHSPSIFGASLSEPHTSESNSAIVSILLLSLWYVRLTASGYKFYFCVLRITYSAVCTVDHVRAIFQIWTFSTWNLEKFYSYYRILNLSNAMDTSSPPVLEVFQEREERSQAQQSGTNAAREERLRRRRERERERRASENPEQREARLVGKHTFY